jgi:hypothetical protein
VYFGFGISVLFCHAEIDDMDEIGVFTAWSADEEVVWFDITVD